jgi:hypothetical protein
MKRTTVRLNFKSLILFVVLSFFAKVNAQTNYYYNGSGNINAIASWGTNTNGSGTTPTNFTSTNRVFNIRNNASPTLNGTWTVSGANSKIIIGDGTSACNFTVGSNFVLTAPVDISAGATITLSTTGSITGIAFGALNATSTVNFASASAQTIPIETYGNLIISGAKGNNDVTFSGSTNIDGNLTISATGNAGAQLLFNGIASTRVFNITGDYIQTGYEAEFGLVAGSITTVNLAGDLVKTGGYMVSTLASANPAFNFTGTTQNIQSNGGTDTKWMNFNVSNGSVCTLAGQFNYNGSTPPGTFTVNSGGTLNCGAFNLVTTSATAAVFVLSSGATLGIGSSAGITTTGAAGNIQSNVRTFNTAGNYVYNAGGAQAAGNALPATVGSLAITNNTVLTVPTAKAVTNNFSIETGSSANLGTGLSHTAGTLTMSGFGTPSGSHGSTTSSATNKNNTFFTAVTGIVTVGTGTCGALAATISGTNSICNGGNTNLSVAITGGLTSYTVVSAAGTVNNYTSGSAISVNPVSTTPYTLTSVKDSNSCAATLSGTATVTVNAVPTAGTLTPSPAAGAVCTGVSVSATATAGTGGAATIVDELQVSLSGGTYNTYTSGSAISTTGQTSVSIRTRRTATGSGCTTSGYNTVTWTVNAIPAAGTLTPSPAAGTICAGTSVSATATLGSGGAGTIVDQLEVSLSGGPYAAYTSGNAISTSGQTSVSIRTRRTATGSGCTTSGYNTVTWTVNAVPTAGTLTPTPTAGSICTGTSVSAAATGGTGGAGTIVDELEVSLSGGSFTAYTSGSAISTTGQTSVSIRTRRTATGIGCTTSGYNTVTWTVNAIPNAGTVTPSPAAGTICAGTLVSATATVGSGGAGTIIDELEYSLSGGTYTVYTSATSINTTGQTSVSIRTRRTATGSGCTTSGYNTVTWTVNAVPAAGTLMPTPAAGAICTGTSVSAAATVGTGGAGTIADELEYSLSGSVYIAYTSGSSISTSGQSSVSIRTRRTATGSGCTTSGYNTVTWTVNAIPNAGTLTPTPATGSICSGTSVSATAAAGTGGAGTIVDQLEISLSGGTYTAYTSGSAISTTGQTSVSIRTRRTATATGCTSSGYNTVAWTINPKSTAAVLSGNAAICSGSPTNLGVAITGGASPYSVVYTDGSSNFTVSGYTTGSNISIAPLATTTYTLISVTSTNGCAGTGNSGSAVVMIDSTTSTNGGLSWSNGTPTGSKSAIFDGSTATLGADFIACALRLRNNAAVTVSSGFDVTLNGRLTVEAGSTFTLNNNANLLQNNTLTNSGNIVVKRNSSALKRLDYTLWSSPVTGQKVYAFSPYTFGNRFYVYRTATNIFNNTDVGFSLTGLDANGVNGTDSNNVQFATAKGYLIRMPWDHPTAATVWNSTFAGVPNNGDITFTMTNGGSGQRFNLIGNPYPSPMSITQFVADNSAKITGTLYFWRETNNNTSNNAYCSWAGGTFTTNAEAQVFNPNGIIRTGQGFFVEALGASTTVDFKNGQRSSDNTNQFFRNANVTNDVDETNRFWLNLTNASGAFSQMAAGYMTNATDGVDLYDGRNINTGNVLLNSILDNADYTIQGKSLPFNVADVIPLSCKITNAGSYTIAIDHVDGLFTGGTQAIYLKDNLTATEYNLQTGPYTFASEAGTFNNRFEITYQSQLANPVFTPNTVVIYSQNNDFVVNAGNTIMASVKVFDIRGRLLQEKTAINSNQTIISGGLANEVLLVQITSEDGVVVTKKVIR